MTGWEGIEDESSKAVPFSQAAMKEVTDDPYWIRGVLAHTRRRLRARSWETEGCRLLLGKWRQES